MKTHEWPTRGKRNQTEKAFSEYYWWPTPRLHGPTDCPSSIIPAPSTFPAPLSSPSLFAYPFPFPIHIDIGICTRYAVASGVFHAATQLAMKWKKKASISWKLPKNPVSVSGK